MNEYHWWADPELAPIGSFVGAFVGIAIAWAIFKWKGDL